MDPTKNDNHVKWYLATRLILSSAHLGPVTKLATGTHWLKLRTFQRWRVVYGHVVRHGGIRALGARRAPVGLGNHGGGDDPGKVDEVGKAVK